MWSRKIHYRFNKNPLNKYTLMKDYVLNDNMVAMRNNAHCINTKHNKSNKVKGFYATNILLFFQISLSFGAWIIKPRAILSFLLYCQTTWAWMNELNDVLLKDLKKHWMGKRVTLNLFLIFFWHISLWFTLHIKIMLHWNMILELTTYNE